MATLTVTSPTFIERLCQTPAILWNVWDYCIPPITTPKNDRLQAARILLYLFGKPTCQLNGMWERGIDSYLQSRLLKCHQQQFYNSVFASCLRFYVLYVGKFSTITFRWYQKTDDLPHDWNANSSYHPWISHDATKINLSYIKITNQGLITLVQGCSNIKDINLTGCKLITDDGLNILGKWCPNIQNIDFGGCKSFTNKGFIALSQWSPNIQMINLENTNITYKGLTVLAKKCPNIQVINLGCTKIFDRGLTALAQRCPNIQDISLRYSNITDKGLIALAQNCFNIQRIHLDICNAVTDKGLIALVKGCPNIQMIDLKGSRAVTDKGLTALAQGCSNIQIFT